MTTWSKLFFSLYLLRCVGYVRHIELIKALGRRVIELRQLKDWSQERLANESDLSINQIGRIERGEINTSVSAIYAISKALKTPLPEMFAFNLNDEN